MKTRIRPLVIGLPIAAASTFSLGKIFIGKSPRSFNLADHENTVADAKNFGISEETISTATPISRVRRSVCRFHISHQHRRPASAHRE